MRCPLPKLLFHGCRYVMVLLALSCLSAITCSAVAATELAARIQPMIDSFEGQVGVAIKQLETGESYEHRADKPMPTASLIKFPLMVTAYRDIDVGKLALDDRITLREEDKVQGSGLLSTPLLRRDTVSASRRDSPDDRRLGQHGDQPRDRSSRSRRFGRIDAAARLPQYQAPFQGFPPRHIDLPGAEPRVWPGQYDSRRNGQASRNAGRWRADQC